MSRLTYIVKRMMHMDYKAMLEKINSIHKKTGMGRVHIFLDMAKCARLYGAGYMDYDLYEMYNLNDEQRDTYITRGRNNDLILKYCDKDYLHYFINKDEFNEVFEKYLHREWISMKKPREEVIAFMGRHDIFMAKPVDGGCGHGIIKVFTNEYKSLDEIYDMLMGNGVNYELEEFIIQHDELNRIYPGSINTVRIVTIVTTEDDYSLLTLPKEQRRKVPLKPHLIAAYFRIGNGKYVDNFNSGGMAAPVDLETGVVLQPAIDKKKNLYEVQPQTGTPIKGFKFPYWEQAKALCEEACQVIPEMGYVGWDVAFTPDGPVFVEANEFPGHDIYQLPEHTPDKIGMMPIFRKLK